MAKCPLCDGAIDVEEDELDQGDVFTCEECGAEIQVAGVNPLELEAAEEEDLDDEEGDLDEEDEEEDKEEEEWR
jgi:alpha-aminoadipate/glutamate carrier protein LysW